MTKQSAVLAGGTLSINVDQSDLPLGALCGFASRKNPKRPFLFVSRVLGRHLPTPPSVMQTVYQRLAAKIPHDLAPSVVFIGMAETAVALGQGVHDAWCQQAERNDALYIHSTRYRLTQHRLLSTFEEKHSHATGHLLHEPSDEVDAALFSSCQTLVLVDDEASTGATFLALTQACLPLMPRLKQVICVTITDWMGQGTRDALARSMPLPARFASLLLGSYTFQASAEPPPKMPDVEGDGEAKDALLAVNWGRLGLRKACPLPDHITQIRAEPDEKILVLGTGEFVYPPFMFAQHLEALGASVMVQATTRSPILEGDEIRETLEFLDAYQDGIPNFLYSVSPKQYDRIFVCYETPPETAQTTLIEALGAEPLFFNETRA